MFFMAFFAYQSAYLVQCIHGLSERALRCIILTRWCFQASPFPCVICISGNIHHLVSIDHDRDRPVDRLKDVNIALFKTSKLTGKMTTEDFATLLNKVICFTKKHMFKYYAKMLCFLRCRISPAANFYFRLMNQVLACLHAVSFACQMDTAFGVAVEMPCCVIGDGWEEKLWIVPIWDFATATNPSSLSADWAILYSRETLPLLQGDFVTTRTLYKPILFPKLP